MMREKVGLLRRWMIRPGLGVAALLALRLSAAAQVPATPGGLTATAVSSNRINLSWSDNSTNELGFDLRWSLWPANPTAASVADVTMIPFHKGGNLAVSDSELASYGIVASGANMATSYDPIVNDFYAELSVSNLPNANLTARGEIVIRRGGDPNPVVTYPVPSISLNGITYVRFHLPELVPGVYKATASIYTANDESLGQARQNFIRFDHARDLPWLGNTLGVTNQVLPPWTPITGVSNVTQTLDLSCWGRTYRISGGGLFFGIDTLAQSGPSSSAKDILFSAVRVDLVQSNSAVTLNGSGIQNISIAAYEASYSGELTGTGWSVATRGRMEYDGYVEHRLTITPTGTRRADRLRLIIPLKPEEATHLHAVGGDWFRSSVSSIALGTANGVLWHSGQMHERGDNPSTTPFGRLMLAGNFRPYVWIGGPYRGLAFMADNDEGWVPDDTEAVPSIEVVRDGAQVNLILNFVARPFTFTKPREIVFSLQATPIRPPKTDWRSRLIQLSLLTAFPGYDSDGWDWNGTMFKLDGETVVGGYGSMPYPLNWARNISKRQYWEGQGKIFTPYQSQLNVMAFGEVDNSRMPPGKQASDVYGYLYPHMAAGNLEHGNLSLTKPDLEYRLWCNQAYIKNAGLKGLYFDQTEPTLGANASAGAGYILDLPDRSSLNGKVQPGYLLSNKRQYFKRLRALFVQNGVANPMIWLHTTDADMVSAFAFAEAFLEGENWPSLTPDQPYFSKKWSPKRMQALGNPAGKWGIGTVWLSMFEGNGLSGWPDDAATMAMRSLQGYTRLHDVNDQWNYLSWSPLDPAQPMTFYPYWDPQVAPALQGNASTILTSAFRQNNRLQVFVFNRSDNTNASITVQVDAAALGIVVPAGSYLASDSVTWTKNGVTTGTLSLSLPPHDYKKVNLYVSP